MPKHTNDVHLLEDIEINKLFSHFFDGVEDVHWFTPILATELNLLAESIDIFLNQKDEKTGKPLNDTGKNRILIPINIGRGHWGLITINRHTKQAEYFDPRGQALSQKITDVIEACIGSSGKNNDIAYQPLSDGIRCGYWVVEKARAFVEKRPLESGHDINKAIETDLAPILTTMTTNKVDISTKDKKLVAELYEILSIKINLNPRNDGRQLNYLLNDLDLFIDNAKHRQDTTIETAIENAIDFLRILIRKVFLNILVNVSDAMGRTASKISFDSKPEILTTLFDKLNDISAFVSKNLPNNDKAKTWKAIIQKVQYFNLQNGIQFEIKLIKDPGSIDADLQQRQNNSLATDTTPRELKVDKLFDAIDRINMQQDIHYFVLLGSRSEIFSSSRLTLAPGVQEKADLILAGDTKNTFPSELRDMITGLCNLMVAQPKKTGFFQALFDKNKSHPPADHNALQLSNKLFDVKNTLQHLSHVFDQQAAKQLLVDILVDLETLCKYFHDKRLRSNQSKLPLPCDSEQKIHGAILFIEQRTAKVGAHGLFESNISIIARDLLRQAKIQDYSAPKNRIIAFDLGHIPDINHRYQLMLGTSHTADVMSVLNETEDPKDRALNEIRELYQAMRHITVSRTAWIRPYWENLHAFGKQLQKARQAEDLADSLANFSNFLINKPGELRNFGKQMRTFLEIISSKNILSIKNHDTDNTYSKLIIDKLRTLQLPQSLAGNAEVENQRTNMLNQLEAKGANRFQLLSEFHATIDAWSDHYPVMEHDKKNPCEQICYMIGAFQHYSDHSVAPVYYDSPSSGRTSRKTNEEDLKDVIKVLSKEFG